MLLRTMGARRAPDEVPPAGTVPAPVAPVAPAAPAAPPPAAPSPAPAPVAPAAVAAPAPVVPAVPGAPAATVEMSSAVLNERIAQAKRAATAEAQTQLLKDLGVADMAAAKAKITAAQAAEDAGKTQAQRDADQIARLTPLAAQVETANATFAAIASDQMSGLTEVQQTAVKALAGDNAALQIQTIKALRPSWGSATTAAPAAGAPGAAPPAAPIAPPAQSAPSQPGPAPANPGAPFNLRAEVDRLAKSTDGRDHVIARIGILNNVTGYIDSFKKP